MIRLQTMPLRFRVWDKGEDRFLDYGGAKTFSLWCLAELLSGYTSDYYIKNLGISQDTGLKDKNGEHIFTGDIVKNTRGEFLAVCYDIENREINCRGNSIIYWDEPSDSSIVVGNIWQNPELLEKNNG